MIKTIRNQTLAMGAAMTAGMMLSAAPAEANNFGSIATNITTSIASLPGLLTALCYLFGILLGVLGIMKIKDHVENPGNTPLKDGAIRLLAGGALFALPIIFEAMYETVGSGNNASAVALNSVAFNVT